MQLQSIWVRDFSLAVLSSSVTVQDRSKPNACGHSSQNPQEGLFPKVVIFGTFLQVQEGWRRKISQLQAQEEWNAAAFSAFCKLRSMGISLKKSEISVYNTIYRMKLQHQRNSD